MGSASPSPINSPTSISMQTSNMKKMMSIASSKGSIKTRVSMTPPIRSSVKGRASSRKSRASMKAPRFPNVKMRTVSQVQSLFKDRSLSKVDDYIRDRTKIEAHEFLKSLAPDASFLQVFLSFNMD